MTLGLIQAVESDRFAAAVNNCVGRESLGGGERNRGRRKEGKTEKEREDKYGPVWNIFCTK